LCIQCQILEAGKLGSWEAGKLDTGCLILDAGYWMLDTGCWILDTGYWILDDDSYKAGR
jgi:hypothetical protein